MAKEHLCWLRCLLFYYRKLVHVATLFPRWLSSMVGILILTNLNQPEATSTMDCSQPLRKSLAFPRQIPAAVLSSNGFLLAQPVIASRHDSASSLFAWLEDKPCLYGCLADLGSWLNDDRRESWSANDWKLIVWLYFQSHSISILEY